MFQIFPSMEVNKFASEKIFGFNLNYEGIIISQKKKWKNGTLERIMFVGILLFKYLYTWNSGIYYGLNFNLDSLFLLFGIFYASDKYFKGDFHWKILL